VRRRPAEPGPGTDWGREADGTGGNQGVEADRGLIRTPEGVADGFRRNGFGCFWFLRQGRRAAARGFNGFLLEEAEVDGGAKLACAQAQRYSTTSSEKKKNEIEMLSLLKISSLRAFRMGPCYFEPVWFSYSVNLARSRTHVQA
jgi:hypothetical protein